METLVGSEPQRLYFGNPPDVRASFLAKMRTCWLSGPKAPLAGYKFDVGEQPSEGENKAAYYGILLSNTQAPSETFEVQFHKYNENTLIVTRNSSLPPAVMDKLKRDIQLWALPGPDCGNS